MPVTRKSRRTCHRAEQHEIGEFGQQPASVSVEQADDDAAKDRTFETAKAADDDDDQRQHQNIPLGAGVERQECAANDTGHARQKRTQGGHENEQAIDVDAGCVDHLTIIDAGPHHRADLRLVVQEPEYDRCHHAEDDDGEAEFRVIEVARQND